MYSFLKFDVVCFCLYISKELVIESLNFASSYTKEPAENLSLMKNLKVSTLRKRKTVAQKEIK